MSTTAALWPAGPPMSRLEAARLAPPRAPRFSAQIIWD